MSPIVESIAMVETGNLKLDIAIQEWLEWDRNEKTSAEILDLVSDKKYDVLSQLLLKRMEFGTAGLRSRMGAGFSRMNDLVVIQTAQGLLKYVKSLQLKRSGIVIGYDGRHHSKRFAELTAVVFLNANEPVYLFSSVCPTPFVPFAVKHYRASVGVMVTASHNPKEDNGYKVYWQNGAQIITPIDKDIAASILEVLKPLESSWDMSVLLGNKLLQDGLDEITELYMSALPLQKIRVVPTAPVVYTAMHGVGWRYVQTAFETAGFPEPIPVVQQRDPDPEFPTVKFPNPEEGRSALDFSILTAQEAGCNIILANDPDADRLAVAELNDGEWKIFNGNELGALLGWWMLQCYLNEKGAKADLSSVHMLSSTVSSKILQTMANHHGFHFHETLTGFKWMGNYADDLISQNKNVIFAFEEAIGFMCGSAVLDKDGVSAAVKMAELIAQLATEGLTLNDKLKQLYATYGHHISLNSYYICNEPLVIKRIFHRLRNLYHKSYPQSILDGKYKIVAVRDLTTKYDTSTPDKKATLPMSIGSEMITFTFENGLVATLRTSGTEPKIKYYTELCASPEIQDLEEVHKILKEMVDGIVSEFLMPEQNGLISR